jgi:hypothetical protein
VEFAAIGSRVGAFVGHAVGLLVRAAVAVGDFVGSSSHQYYAIKIK